MSTPIPYNLITGFLGAGKTTTIAHLLQQKPTGERWAVLVNEFGKAGVDGELLHPDSGIFIDTVAGGCLCCDAELMFRVGLHRLLKKAQPHRLLIEPTGLGHAWRIAQVLAEPQHQALLSPRATLCLVSAHLAEQSHASGHPSFHEQLWLADRVLLNKADAVSPAQLKQACDWLVQHGVQADAIIPTHFGEVSSSLLDLPMGTRPPRFFPRQTSQPDRWHALETPHPGVRLWRGESQGWHVLSLTASDDWCLQDDLTAWLKTLGPTLRCKGILQTDGGWQALNASEGHWQLTPLLGGSSVSLELMWPASAAVDLAAVAQQLLSRLAARQV